MRQKAFTATFGGDRLSGFPWTGLGRVIDATSEEVLSNECRCDGALVAEPGVRVRGYLVRFGEEQRRVHVINGEVRDGEAGAILWTEDEDVPREFWNEVRALRADELDAIERNSTTLQLERLAAGHNVETLLEMEPNDPARGIAALMVERNAPDEDAPAEAAKTPTGHGGEPSERAGG